MAKRFNEPISVYKPQTGRPFFVWRGKRYSVLRIINRWCVSSNWWKGNDQINRDHFQVQAKYGQSDPGTFELLYDNIKKEWRLAKVMD